MKQVPAGLYCHVLQISINWHVLLKQNSLHLVTENFWSSHNDHVNKSTWSPECCYDWGQGAVVCERVVSRWWLLQVHAGYGISGKPYPKIWHHMPMKIAGTSVVVFLINHNFPHHVYFVSGIISITDTYNPDTGVGTVFNGKLRTIRRLALGDDVVC